MSLINPLIRTAGEDVTLTRVTNAVYDSHDNLDEASSTIETVTVQAIKRRPNAEQDLGQEGRRAMTSALFILESTVDVSAQREGRPDWITDADGETYQIENVQRDKLPIGSTELVKAHAEPLPGV